MSQAPEVTFRDFAGAVMQGDMQKGAEVLTVLLGVDAPTASAAATFFQQGMTSGPDFMMKAMGMRTVVTGGTEAELLGLLGDCFDLHGDVADRAAKAIFARFRTSI